MSTQPDPTISASIVRKADEAIAALEAIAAHKVLVRKPDEAIAALEAIAAHKVLAADEVGSIGPDVWEAVRRVQP